MRKLPHVTQHACIGRLVAKKRAEFIRQATMAHEQLRSAVAADRTWGDCVASTVAAINTNRAVMIGWELLVLLEVSL